MTHASAMTPKRTGNHRIFAFLNNVFFIIFSLMDLCVRFRRPKGHLLPGGTTLTETPGDGKDALIPRRGSRRTKIKDFLHRGAEKAPLFVYMIDIIEK
jgi:hypothetical protein